MLSAIAFFIKAYYEAMIGFVLEYRQIVVIHNQSLVMGSKLQIKNGLRK